MLFLKTMLSLLKDEGSISELMRVITAYENMLDATATKEKVPVGAKSLLGNTTAQPLIFKHVNQVSKKPRGK